MIYECAICGELLEVDIDNVIDEEDCDFDNDEYFCDCCSHAAIDYITELLLRKH